MVARSPKNKSKFVFSGEDNGRLAILHCQMADRVFLQQKVLSNFMPVEEDNKALMKCEKNMIKTMRILLKGKTKPKKTTKQRR